MRISEWGWRRSGGLAFAAVTVTAVVIAAFSFEDQPGDGERFTSPGDAYRRGMENLSQGDVTGALPALEFAAEHGTLGAQLRLARIYGDPDSPNRDQRKALHYAHLVAKDHGDIDRLHPAARDVSRTLRVLAEYYRDGVPAVGLRPDPYKASQLMRHAASYFRDVEAQFEIGRMYAEGNGLAKNRHLAVRWLLKASQKRYAPAQAYLGELLWAADSAEITRARGLALLALAVGNAGSAQRSSIEQRYRETGARARPAEIERAERFVAAWDHLRARDATIALSQFLPRGSYQTPAGSTIVPDSDFPSLKELVAALSEQPKTPFLWGPGIGWPEKAADSSAAQDHGDTNLARRFLLNQAVHAWNNDGSDPFAAIETTRFGGQTLSVGVEVAPKLVVRSASDEETSVVTQER